MTDTDKDEAVTRANADGFEDLETSQLIHAPKSTKSLAGLPAGNAGTFQTVGDLAARIVRDLGRRIGAEYDL